MAPFDSVAVLMSSYVVEPSAAADSPLRRSPSTETHAAQSRRITFRWRVFAKYYVVDLLASALGPFSFIIAVPCWGSIAAKNMKYVPGGCKDFIGSLIGTIIFWPLMYFPIVYGCLVALRGRAGSDFDLSLSLSPLALCYFSVRWPALSNMGSCHGRDFETLSSRSNTVSMKCGTAQLMQ